MDPEPSWSWSPGDELAPGLLAWALLGDGRRCETLLAWDLGRWCPVAVKLPRPVQGARAVAALAVEARVAAVLAHPGVRRLLDDRLDRPRPHLVFEYVEGPTLDDALAGEGPFHPIDVLLTGMQLAAALGHLHGRGLAHLDVKPGNAAVPAALDRAVATLLAPDPTDRPATTGQALSLLSAAMPADAAEEDRPWPTWATGRLARWRGSAMERPPLVPRPA